MASTTTPRPRTTPSTRMARGRRKPEPSGLKGLMAKLPDAIPGVKRAGKRSSSSSIKSLMSGIADALPFGGRAKRGKSSASASGKRAGGAALAAGAAGLAIKNRSKITSMMKRDGSREEDATAAGSTTTTPDTAAQDASVSRLDVTPSDVATPPQPGTAG